MLVQGGLTRKELGGHGDERGEAFEDVTRLGCFQSGEESGAQKKEENEKRNDRADG